jgi:WD40 repeat protein
MATANLIAVEAVKRIALPGDFLSIACVPGKDHVFAGSSDGKIYSIDFAAAKPAATSWVGHVSYVSGLVLAGKHLVSAGSDRKMVWWDVEARRPVHTHEQAHARWIRRLVLSPNAQCVASVADDMVCRLWDAATGKGVREFRGHPEKTRHHFRSKMFTCAFSPDGKLIATADQEGRILVWEVATGKQAAVCEAPAFYEWDRSAEQGNGHSFGGVRSLAFAPDGKHLAAGGIDNHDAAIVQGTAMVQVFDWQTGQKTHEFKAGGNGIVENLCFHHKGDWLLGALGAGAAGKLLFYDLARKQVLREAAAPMPVFGLAVNETSDAIDTAGRGQVVRWSLKAYEGENREPPPPDNPARGLRNRLAAGGG